ncbi:MAG TPA: hypothetical protein VJB14_18485 [Planctomycetota bacterium]|nr:hypothetical protein [Planctomycetota bacterium]
MLDLMLVLVALMGLGNGGTAERGPQGCERCGSCICRCHVK